MVQKMYDLNRLFQSIFPNRCLLCDQICDPGTATGVNFCNHCQQTLPYLRRACPTCAAVLESTAKCGYCLSHRIYFESSVSVFKFAEPVSSYIYRFKYHHQFYLGKILSLELFAAISELNAPLPDLIVPVPLHGKRLRQRGFNQSAVIARHLSKKLNIPCKNDYLARRKFSKPQIELTARERKAAVKNAFILNHNRRYNHIALVDDVVTTTHTVNQAAKALKLGGTQHVCVWSLARNT